MKTVGRRKSKFRFEHVRRDLVKDDQAPGWVLPEHGHILLPHAFGAAFDDVTAAENRRADARRSARQNAAYAKKQEKRAREIEAARTGTSAIAIDKCDHATNIVQSILVKHG